MRRAMYFPKRRPSPASILLIEPLDLNVAPLTSSALVPRLENAMSVSLVQRRHALRLSWCFYLSTLFVSVLLR